MSTVKTVVGALVAGLPFIFGALRLAETRWDTRYLWMALATSLGAALVLGLARRRGRIGVAWVAAAVLGAAACGAAGALVLGANAGPGVAIVAAAFGACSGTGAALIVAGLPTRHRGL